MKAFNRLGVLFILSAALGPACASMCAIRDQVAVVNAYEHIFVAQLKSAALSPDKTAIEATFEVEEVLKGQPRQVQRIRATFSDDNYTTKGALVDGGEPAVSPGMHLLVFANGNGPAIFGACSDTSRLYRHNDGRIEAVRTYLRSR